MMHLYRAGQITRRTRVYGVIATRSAHSLSPLLHNTAFRARKVDAVFVPFLVRDLSDFLRSIDALGVAGFAITIPHKERILRHLDDCDPLALALGRSIPLLSAAEGASTGTIQITSEFCEALSAACSWRGSRVLLLGQEARREQRLSLWHSWVGRVPFSAPSGACPCSGARRRSSGRRAGRITPGIFDAIVNCTPVGMHPHVVRRSKARN